MAADFLASGTAGAGLPELVRRVGHDFRDFRLLELALTHRSYSFEQGKIGEDYERLEFLGDAVLDLVVGSLLFHRFPSWPEGRLTAARAALVNEGSLAQLAEKLGLGALIRLGRGEQASGGRNKASILSCTLEALVGAVFVDGGFEPATRLCARLFSALLEENSSPLYGLNPKSELQESLQARHREQPQYRLDLEEGPAHDRRFTVSVLFQGEVLGSGSAGNKKEAEQTAAAQALALLATRKEE